MTVHEMKASGSSPANGNVSFWYADIGGTPPLRAPLPGSTAADVCIVGGGYTGLWTAYYLKCAKPDLNVVILEKEFAGYGASGRNGGWLSGNFSWSRERYLSTGSPQGVIDLQNKMIKTVGEVIDVAAANGIDADILRTDILDIATTQAQFNRLRDLCALKAKWQMPPERRILINRNELRLRLDVKDAVGAVVTHGAARVQPAKLVRGLAAMVERMGVKIFEQSAAVRIDAGAVVTAHGTVRAPTIVRATEGFTPGLPGYRRQLLPLRSAIIVTEPLPDSLWAQIGWAASELMSHGSHTYAYLQRTREGRIVIGGRGIPYNFGSRTDINGETEQRTIQLLHQTLISLFPPVKDVKIDHAWCGVLGVPRDWCASVGYDQASGMAWAGGYVGNGVSTSNLAGQTLADLILDRNTDLVNLPWVNRGVQPWEPEPFRWLGVHLMYRLYALADRLEAGGNGKTSRIATLANRLTGR
jgi:glycine/D-amino acid oxidase-like deaminating enzyme